MTQYVSLPDYAGSRKILLDEIAEPASPNPGVLAQMGALEMREWLNQAVNGLTDREMLFIKMHYEEGLALSEVAEMLGVTMGNIYTLKHRVVNRLRAAVDEPTTS